MKKKNHIIHFIISVALLCTMLPSPVWAEETAPFTVVLESGSATIESVDEAGYTPYEWDAASSSMRAATPVPLYTIQIPEGTETVSLRFSENRLAYNYTLDGTIYIAGSYDDSQLGADYAEVTVDANVDGEPDCIQVQTPYDNNWQTTVLYAITFHGATTDPTPEPIDETELLHRIAAKYHESGAAGDPNAAWITADMMAYEAAFPDSEYTLTEPQKQSMVDEAIAALASESVTVGNAAKYLLSLVAMGYDPSQLTTAEGKALDGKAVLDALTFEGGAVTSAAQNSYTLPYVIIAYQQFADNTDEIASLTDAAVQNQADWLDTTWGVDGLTPYLLALAPYPEANVSIQDALNQGMHILADAQEDSGSIGTPFGTNAATDGLAITGLAAMGEDAKKWNFSETQKVSLLEGLIRHANAEKDGFGSEGDSFSTEQGFRGLLAATQSQEGTSYRIYDFSGQNRQPAEATRGNVTFHVVPEDASIQVTDAAGAVVDPVTGNGLYQLPEGVYEYVVRQEGYQSKRGTVTVTGEDISKRNQQTVHVSLSKSTSGGGSDTVTVSVQVLVHDATGCDGTVTYKQNPKKFSSLLQGDRYTVTLKKNDGTARDALVAALDDSGISYVEISNGYFPTIGNFTEFTHGGNSGWLYLVNGAAGTTAMKNVTFNRNSSLVVFFTDDYSKDYGSEKWSGGGSSGGSSTVPLPTYSVHIPEIERVTATASPASAKVGEVVTLTVTAQEGYATERVTVMDASGNEVSVSEQDDGTFTFTMPSGDVEVRIDVKEEPSTDHANCPSQDFQDIDTSLWYHADLDFVLEKGIMKGVSTGIFAPNDAMTRGMFVTMLYRMEGEPQASPAGFEDVTAGSWFEAAVNWGKETGVVTGFNERTFAPKAEISREQMAAMMYRYAQWKKYDTSQKGDLAKFTDGDAVYAYAKSAMVWAHGVGLMQGMTETTLAPHDGATRAQAAAILHRFSEIMP